MIWSSLSQPWRVCVQEAWTAYCAGSVPIGACITNAQVSGADRVLARGRNCMLEPSAQGYGLAGNRMAHAEMNALYALGGHDLELDARTCTLYTTMEPCPMCIGAAWMYWIGKLCYAARDPVAGSVSFVSATPFMEHWPIEVCGPPDGDLESALLAIQAEFLLRHGSRWIEARAFADPAYARAVRLGRELFVSGELVRRGEQGVPVEGVLDWVVQGLSGRA